MAPISCVASLEPRHTLFYGGDNVEESQSAAETWRRAGFPDYSLVHTISSLTLSRSGTCCAIALPEWNFFSNPASVLVDREKPRLIVFFSVNFISRGRCQVAKYCSI